MHKLSRHKRSNPILQKISCHTEGSFRTIKRDCDEVSLWQNQCIISTSIR